MTTELENSASGDALIDFLERTVKHSNAYRIAESYRIYVSSRAYDVAVLDQGPNHDEYRYAVEVQDLDTGEISRHGNGGSTPQEALDVFHWHSIIKDPDTD